MIKVYPSKEAKEIVEYVRAGDTIKAIKRYREVTGCGLAVAKKNIDELVALAWSTYEPRPIKHRKLNINVEVIDEK